MTAIDAITKTIEEVDAIASSIASRQSRNNRRRRRKSRAMSNRHPRRVRRRCRRISSGSARRRNETGGAAVQIKGAASESVRAVRKSAKSPSRRFCRRSRPPRSVGTPVPLSARSRRGDRVPPFFETLADPASFALPSIPGRKQRSGGDDRWPRTSEWQVSSIETAHGFAMRRLSCSGPRGRNAGSCFDGGIRPFFVVDGISGPAGYCPVRFRQGRLLLSLESGAGAAGRSGGLWELAARRYPGDPDGWS